MGWPYVGETTQLYSSKNPNVFFARKRNKYGPIFKTHILGCPCVMVSSPEAAKFVLVTQAHLFKPTFPASKERMLGPQAIFFQQGDYHAHLRRLVSRAFSPEAIRGSVPAIEAIALRSLGSWEDLQVNTFQEMKTLEADRCVGVMAQYALNVALLSIFGEEEMQYIEELKQCYLTLEKGYNSMPVNLPGTLFHKAMKARKRLGAIVAHIISARRERERGSDLLGSFMDGREALTDDQIADNAIGVIFAARDTTASVLTWMVKFLGDNPAVLKAVTEEHAEIAREKALSGEALSWADTRRMRVTGRVIQETMRVASILSFTFREAVEDVEYQGEQSRGINRFGRLRQRSAVLRCPSRSTAVRCLRMNWLGKDALLTQGKLATHLDLLSSVRAGYLIPKGWKVLPLFRNIHHNPDHFPSPEKFDPSRFEVAPKPNTFMPFGNGTHSCPGNELAKLEMLVLCHHLATKYRWSTSKSESGVQFGPFALPINGLPMTFTRKDKNKA
ncbi:Abscisic acid 8'-hydroxylase 1 [Triticum urartu]|uniref:Abscisic acid 8'-hydroxylase 1 n=1 Tax=Triticum urartu TaxID=4572 RepID=M8AUG8_TRIUA|nr:Abscisic acid 8'-hydroxylase 1 [Triticum urartu]